MKKILTGLAVVTALSTASFAESVIVDLSVGAGSMSTDAPTVAFGDSEALKVTNTLNDPSQSYMWAQFDHAIPIVPNVRIEQNTLEYTGTATAAAGSFNGTPISTTVASTVDLSNQDIILYWGVPFSTWIPMIDEADFGFGLKTFDGQITVAGALDEVIDGSVPYGYAKLHISPPFMFGIGLEAEIKTLSVGDFTFSENIFKLDWSVEAPIPVIDLEIGVEAGYRSTSIGFDDGDATAAGDIFLDLEFTGIFFGAFAKFGI